MAGYGGAFVAFDAAKAKYAVAVAEAGCRGEVRFLGEVENTAAVTARRKRRVRGCKPGRAALKVAPHCGAPAPPRSPAWLPVLHEPLRHVRRDARGRSPYCETA
jgi:hypothetical protein